MTEYQLSDIVTLIADELQLRDTLILGFEELKKPLEQNIFDLQNITAVVQRPRSLNDFAEPYEKGLEYFEDHICPNVKRLDAMVRQHPYHQFKHTWRPLLQTLVFNAMYVRWLGNNGLPSPHSVADMLKVHFETDNVVTSNGSVALHFTVEDYLHAVVDFSNELARLMVNLVTNHMVNMNNERYDVSISGLKYVLDSIQGASNEAQKLFLSLNLKNDSLRKRGDSIKYDVKKIQEVLYDLAIRGIVN